MTNTIKTLALALSATSMTVALPAQAADFAPVGQTSHIATLYGADALADQTVAHKKHKRHKHRDHYSSYDRYDRSDYRSYDEPVSRNTRIWRDRDGRYYCQKENGTTGLLIGAGVGGLIGHEVAGRGDRTLGVILGAAGGALLGREIDRRSTKCR